MRIKIRKKKQRQESEKEKEKKRIRNGCEKTKGKKEKCKKIGNLLYLTIFN